MRHIKVLSADKFSVPDKKNLHYCVLSISSQRNNILILTIAVRNLLFGRSLLYAIVQIPVADSLLKFKIFRSLLHFLFQFL